MMNILFWIANIIIIYALLVVIVTAIRKPTDIRYTFLNLFRQRRRSGVTLLAITLGGVAVFIFGGFVDYSFWALREQTIRTNLGHIQLYQQGYLSSGANNSLQYTIDNYDEVKQLLQADPVIAPKIATITGQLAFTGIISQYDKGASTFFTGVGIEPLTSLVLGSLDKIISGSDLSRVEQQDITLGSGIANALSAGYGDWVDMLVVNPQGGQNAMSSQVRGVFQSGIKEYDDTAIKMPLHTAQRLLQTQDVSKIIIMLQDTNQTEEVLARVNQLIEQHQFKLEARSWDELAIFYHQVVNLFEGIFLFIKSIVSVIVVFMIGNTLMMNVIERTREIATLRALGLNQSYIGRLFVLEGIIIGIIGSALSVSFGMLIAALININGIPMPPSPGYTQGYLAFVLWDQDFNLFWFSCALPLVTALIASIIPARRASKLVIAQAFRFV
ncbi:ABC transporter permease [Serratia fonticola]|uniref:ABC transporter permease n=1 Tax=Serratia fonticola TaxID=47917 RepID=UPI001AE16524|nr:FtsX-like permease family protein [Serratia fonticola]MBP0996327.1 ABC transporter permease [Serratia fonticola]MBP1001992.1 ABC transporter permease [Serratia fonticola]MBP1011201.1 ABC transporter permease [Serratia fonticola]